MISFNEFLESIEPEWWHSGYCSVFAAAFQKRYGGEMWAIVNHSRKYDHDELVHVYCVIGKTAYDSRGAHKISQVSKIPSYKGPEMDKDNDVVFLWKKVNVAWLSKVHDDYDPSLFPDVYAYIDSHPELFGELEETA